MSENKNFRVHLGDPVQLQYIPEDGRERLSAKVIGHQPGASLIISAPKAGGKTPFLSEGQPMVVRMMQGTNVYGFEAQVLKYHNLPFPHVHLSHPQDIERITVRGSRRVDTELVVSVTAETQSERSYPASMLNTSATGALLQVRHPLGQIEDILYISLELELVNMKKYIRLKSVVRNVTEPSGADPRLQVHKYGVQFIDMNDEQKLLINAYVYEQIVKQLDA